MHLDLSKASKVQYFVKDENREDGGNYLKFHFSGMIMFVMLEDKELEIVHERNK